MQEPVHLTQDTLITVAMLCRLQCIIVTNTHFLNIHVDLFLSFYQKRDYIFKKPFLLFGLEAFIVLCLENHTRFLCVQCKQLTKGGVEH